MLGLIGDIKRRRVAEARRRQRARETVFMLWLAWIDEKRDGPPTVEEAIAACAECRNAEDYAYELMREAMLIYLGVGWGVGPYADGESVDAPFDAESPDSVVRRA